MSKESIHTPTARMISVGEHSDDGIALLTTMAVNSNIAMMYWSAMEIPRLSQCMYLYISLSYKIIVVVVYVIVVVLEKRLESVIFHNSPW